MINFLFALLIFFTPSNLFIKFWENLAYIQGLRVDYLIVKFFLSDLVIIPLITLLLKTLSLANFKQIKQQLTAFPSIWLILLIIFIRQFFSAHLIASLYSYVKFLEIATLAYFIILRQKNFNLNIMAKTLSITIYFQTCVAIFQFYKQKHLFSYLFFGESNLTHYYNIARANFFGQEKILAYGTTAHPNILAGILVTFFLIQVILFLNNQLLSKKILFFNFYLILIVIFITQSLSAFFLLAWGLLLIFKPNIWQKLSPYFVISALFITILALQFIYQHKQDNPSITRRHQLNAIAMNLFKQQPFFGFGLNQFTYQVEINNLMKNDYFVQPAHNLISLILAEQGLIGLFLLFIILKISVNFKKTLVILLPALALDHYLYTNQGGLIIVCLMFFTVNLLRHSK